MTRWQVLTGDVREKLSELADGSVQCGVTSVPYWGGLRDYGHENQIGLERDPADYVSVLVGVFSGLRRVLTTDGTLWVNVGDVYAASGKGGGGNKGGEARWQTIKDRKGFRMPPDGYKQKDLTLVAFAMADALRRDGWYLRATIIWRKPSAVEPIRFDRVSLSHEYVFHLAKEEQYLSVSSPWWNGSVWDIAPEAYPGFPAAMPEELARRCILSSTHPGHLVIDPFCGSGTTGVASVRHGRNFVGVELNPAYVELARKRIGEAVPLFAQEQAVNS